MTLSFTKYFPWGGETHFKEKVISGEKIHTIRPNEKKRWRCGIICNMVTGNRTKYRYEFKTAECVSTQNIVIVFNEMGKIDFVTIDSKQINNYELVAKNDGLNLLDFEKWFYNQSKDGVYKGTIIHWTNMRY